MANAESPEPRPAGIPRWLALALAAAVWITIPRLVPGEGTAGAAEAADFCRAV
jgi:hypothetical protein